MAKSRHDELSTIQKIEKLVDELQPQSARPRVLEYLKARFDDPNFQQPRAEEADERQQGLPLATAAE